MMREVKMQNQQNFFENYIDHILKSCDIPQVFFSLKDIKDGMAYLNEFYKPEIEFLQKKNEIINFIIKIRSDVTIKLIDNMRLVATRLTRTIPFNQLCKDDLYANLSFEVESLIIKGMYEVLKNTNPNDNETIARLVQGL